MPQQLIYTSAPQGVDVGRSGYCTVARSSTMGESLVQRLEQFSYYERLSEHGGEAERTVFIFRNIDIRGKAYHVLSRIKDAPADYTGRTNFIAQHLVFTPDEVVNMPTPAVLLNHWSGWEDHWEQEPTLFANESWTDLDELKKRTFLPAKHWFSETADHGRAAGLLGLNAGIFTAHDFKPKLILDLLSESLELLQLEGPNWRSLAWQRTFSVGCQPQDNPADFRWRFLTSGLPFESSVTQGRAPLELRRLRAPSNSQQVQFAQKGPVAPQFTRLPRAGEAVQLNEGETLVLDGEAQSLPGPSIYRWYRVEKDNVTLQEIDGAHGAKLEIPNSQRGKHRYKVRAWDSITDQYAESPLLVVEVKEKVKIPSLSGRPISTAGSVSPSSGASKPIRQLQLKKSSTYSSRSGENSLGEELEEDISHNFFRANANTFLIVSVILFLVVSTAMLLKVMDFSAPQFKDHKTDWLALKVTKNPLAFEKSPRITEETRQYIADYKNTIGSTNASTDFRDHLLTKINGDLISADAENPVRNDSTQKNEGRPLAPINGQPKNSDIPAKKEPVKKTLGPISVILAENQWKSLYKPLEEKAARIGDAQSKARNIETAAENTAAKAAMNAKAKQADHDKIKNEPNAIALKKATDEKNQADKKLEIAKQQSKQLQTDLDKLEANERTPMLNRQKSASQLQHGNSWPYFPTNITPTLRWSELGQTLTESVNRVIVEWRTNDWNFKADNWSLQISQSGAAYQPTKQPSAILVEIANIEDAAEPSSALSLLLFSPNTNLSFKAKIDGDNLVASDELRQLLGRLFLHKSHSIRLVANYPPFKPTTNSLEEVYRMVSNPPWKLMLTEQLAKQVTQLEKIETTRNALSRLDTLWKEVKERTGRALLEATFSEAVDATSPENKGGQMRTRMERQFWHALNRLVVVAIFAKNDVNKTLQLQDMTSSDEAGRKFDTYFAQKEADEYFKARIKLLTTDLEHLKRLWIPESSEYLKALKHFSEVGTNLEAEIQKLRAGEGKIVSTKLRVDLQFQASETTWLPITRLDCR